MLRRRLFTLILLVMVLVPAMPAAADNNLRCFPETGYCASGRILEYWEQNGGLAVFGYPIGEQRNELNADTGQTYLTQWFERNRFELHPENAGTPYDVLLGRLGADRLLQQGRDWQTFAKADPGAAHYFGATGHAIAPEFWGYWSGKGLDLGDPGVSERESMALFGLPLSEPAMETNSSGDTVLTQWFERARFEYHPGNPEPYKVLLGLLGNEVWAGQPRFVYPAHQQVLDYAGDWILRAEMEGAQQYRWVFSQGSVRHERRSGGSETAIVVSSPVHGQFAPGDLRVEVQGVVNGSFTPATIIVVRLV